MCRVWVRIIHLTMAPTRHISEFFFKWTKPQVLSLQIYTHSRFTPDLRLFKRNAARDEGISANSPTQHRITANIWQAMTSSNALFFVESQNQVSLVLFFKSWVEWRVRMKGWNDGFGWRVGTQGLNKGTGRRAGMKRWDEVSARPNM